jgi:hypothetical protein
MELTVEMELNLDFHIKQGTKFDDKKNIIIQSLELLNSKASKASKAKNYPVPIPNCI